MEVNGLLCIYLKIKLVSTTLRALIAVTSAFSFINDVHRALFDYLMQRY